MVTFLALHLAATDSSSAFFAVGALEPLSAGDFTADRLELEPADGVRFLGVAFLREARAKEEAKLVGEDVLVAQEEVELRVDAVAELAGLRGRAGGRWTGLFGLDGEIRGLSTLTEARG